MNSGRIAQHRNYGQVMARHEKELRIKKVVKIFTYFLIAVFVFIIFLLVRQWEQKQKGKSAEPKAPSAHVIDAQLK
jgi:large-conductance mechanosensitive channel